MSSHRLENLVKDLAPRRPTRIVDVGARYTEEPSYAPLVHLGLAEVWGFEPEREAFEELVAKAGPNEHYVQAALGDGTAKQLHVCYGRGFTSILRPNQEFINFFGRWVRPFRVEYSLDIQTERLDEISEIPEFDLLKIDIQGAENLVFQNGRERLGRAVAVITEASAMPMYESQPTLGDQIVELQYSGFFLHKLLHFKQWMINPRPLRQFGPRKYRNQLLDGDVVFLRSLLKRQLMSDEQLKHLAIIADAVISSYDIAVHTLEILRVRGCIGRDAVTRYVDAL